ncbi:fasciclin-2-like isoform X2 [Danaus plexippus]|uniref:fasciclin-2-like isoform X2 n=1 Tax=Danaus plexippus TaxID=13037 RepID=UPI002AB00D56|nr:fasciclin-2-like isoform X2 [Danaus plexippus]
MRSNKEKNIIISVFVSVFISGSQTCFTNNQVEFTKIKSGSSFYQECKCELGTGETLRWLDTHDQDIPILRPGTKSNVYTEWLDRNTYSVYISSLSKSISGAYKCVTDHNGREYSMVYHVEAYDPPYFVNTKPDQYVVSGKDAVITCEARGDTEPLISWYKEQDGFVEITNDDKYEVTSEGLKIKDVTKDDNGLYKCAASDLETGEGIDQEIHVEVITMPTIIDLTASTNSKVIEGESLTIECVADGVPHPEYSWKKIGYTGENVSWHEIANTIVFDEVQESDRGAYECTAVNNAGNFTKIINIEVLVAPNITELNNVTAVEGSTAQISCKASGRPIPKINMMFLGDESDEQSIVWDIKNASDTEVEFYLSFLRVNRSHAGVYECNATNDVDFDIKEMEFRVLYPPYFTTPVEDVWSWNGKSINLSCEHSSDPPGVITWRYQGNEISAENQMEINKIIADKLHKSPLIIENKTLYGVYECTAKNEFGEAKKMITLREGFVPAAINNVSLANLTSYSVTFTIEPPPIEGPGVIGFTAEYDEVDNYNVTDIHTNRTWSIHRPLKIDKLKPNTSYYVKFAAINEVGTGPWSDVLEFATLEQSTPDEPEWEMNVEEIAVKDKVLKWKNSDLVDFYLIRQCPIKNGFIEEESCEITQLDQTNEFHLDEMNANTTYYIELIAQNTVGNSTTARITVTIPGEEAPYLSSAALIGLSILAVFLCLVMLDLLLLLWRRQGVIANCCVKKKKNNREESLNSRDKKGLLKDKESNGNGHKEYEYNKNTGAITGKHSSV